MPYWLHNDIQVFGELFIAFAIIAIVCLVPVAFKKLNQIRIVAVQRRAKREEVNRRLIVARNTTNNMWNMLEKY